MFIKLAGCTTVLRSRGCYRPADLYSMGGDDCNVYAKNGSSFIKLCAHGDTSVPHVKAVSFQLSSEVVLRNNKACLR